MLRIQDDISIEADHSVVGKAGVLMPENCPKTAHSPLDKVIAEFVYRNVPVLERGHGVRDIIAGDMDASTVICGQNAGLSRLRVWILRFPLTGVAQDDTIIYRYTSAPG